MVQRLDNKDSNVQRAAVKVLQTRLSLSIEILLAVV